MADFIVPEDMNDQSWALLSPKFEKGQTSPLDWYNATNNDKKTLLMLAVEGGRSKEIAILLKQAQASLEHIAPGTTAETNLVWLSIANINIPGGKDVLDCLLRYPGFVRTHAFKKIEKERGQSAIHFAALTGIIDLFKTLEGFDRKDRKSTRLNSSHVS